MKALRPVATILLLVLLSPSVIAQDVTANIIVWNVESGDADPTFIANQMASKGDIALWGLSEVQNQQWLDIFEGTLERATGEPHAAILGSTGNADKLAILYREDVFEAIGEAFEIDEIQIGNSGLRSALGLRLKGQQTGQEFFFVVNHLKASGGAGNIAKRILQAQAMNAWARNQDIPIVMGGDLNTPYSVATGTIPKALEELTQNGPFFWIEPTIKVKTQASHFNSILDYILVANAVGFWQAESMILRRDSSEPVPVEDNHEFPDDAQSTDHRPVLARFSLHKADAIARLQEEIATLQAQLTELNRRLELLQSH